MSGIVFNNNGRKGHEGIMQEEEFGDGGGEHRPVEKDV